MMQLVYGILLALMISPTATNEEVRHALEQPITITFQNQTLPEVFERIAAETHVGIYIAPDHLDLLPNGPKTKLSSMKISGQSLGDVLEEMLKPIGMTYRVAGGRIEVVPCEAIKNKGRPTNWNELNTLKWLSSTQWGHDPADARRLDKHLQFRVHDAQAATKLRDAMNRAGAGTIHDVLFIACKLNGWTWYLRNTEIIIDNKTRHALEKWITIRAERRRLTDVLAELSTKADIPISLAPGTLNRLDTNTRDHVSLLVQNKTLLDGLKVISGATGLSYRVEKSRVVFYLPNDPVPVAPLVNDDDDPVVATIKLPGGGEVVVRESQIDDETRDLLRKLAEKLANTAAEAQSDNKP